MKSSRATFQAQQGGGEQRVAKGRLASPACLGGGYTQSTSWVLPAGEAGTRQAQKLPGTKPPSTLFYQTPNLVRTMSVG